MIATSVAVTLVLAVWIALALLSTNGRGSDDVSFSPQGAATSIVEAYDRNGDTALQYRSREGSAGGPEAERTQIERWCVEVGFIGGGRGSGGEWICTLEGDVQRTYEVVDLATEADTDGNGTATVGELTVVMARYEDAEDLDRTARSPELLAAWSDFPTLGPVPSRPDPNVGSRNDVQGVWDCDEAAPNPWGGFEAAEDIQGLGWACAATAPADGARTYVPATLWKPLGVVFLVLVLGLLGWWRLRTADATATHLRAERAANHERRVRDPNP